MMANNSSRRLLLFLVLLAVGPSGSWCALNSSLLIAYWPMNYLFLNNEISGDASLALDLQTGIKLTNGPSGAVNSAYQTNGTLSAYIGFNWPSWSATETYTITMWTWASTSSDIYFDCSTTSSNKMSLARSGTNKITFSAGSTASNQWNSCNQGGAWVFVGVVINPSTGKWNTLCGTSFEGWQTFGTGDPDGNSYCYFAYHAKATVKKSTIKIACASIYNQAITSSTDLTTLQSDCDTFRTACLGGTNCQAGTCRPDLTSSTGYSCNCTLGWGPPETCDTPVCDLPCQNGGNCTAPNICTCASGWSGIDCTSVGCSPACINGNCTGAQICTCEPGWSGSLCEVPICTTPCINNGTCVAPDTCQCTAQWNGTACEIPICTIPCQHGGTCSAPNTCTCTSSWLGSKCQTPNCSPSCKNGGNCIAPGNCSCINGWLGSDCSLAVCNPGCENGGTCIAPNNCTCDSTHSGSSCHWYICSQGCYNGNCTSPNVCTCETGWTGADCNTAICHDFCENNGTCTAPDTCTCTYDFTGPTCLLPQCYGTGCKNGGTCISPNNCICTTEYYGYDCGLAHCVQTCLHGGNCTAPNYCTCTQDLWEGNDCSTPLCVPNCANGGTCIWGGVCSCGYGTTGPRCEQDFCDPACINGNCTLGSCACEFGWTGPLCTIDYCFPSCQNGGTCSAGYCFCDPMWSGPTCNIEVCSPDCQNGGTCINQVCQCPTAFTGSECEITCPTSCLNGGTCVAGTCQCAPGWTGSDCSTTTCTPGFCKHSGTCAGVNTCACPSRWTGADCTKPNCIPACVSGVCIDTGSASECVCSSNWEGTYCQSPLCIPRCSNGGTCKIPGGSSCYCINQWTGSSCTVIANTVYIGSSAFAPDGSAVWTTSKLVRMFSPETIDTSTQTGETCCPCGSMVMDGNCYFTKNLDLSLYVETPVNYMVAQQTCVQYGGTLATFSSGQAKMAAFFSWLASDANIQLQKYPADFWFTGNDVCLWLGVYRDLADFKWYWETYPPVEVSSSLWVQYQDVQWNNNSACVVPHKTNPLIRSANPSDTFGVICQIANPCSHTCRYGSTRVFDRCYTTGSTTAVDRLAASQSCTGDGGTLSSVRQAFEFPYWSNAVYGPSYNIKNLWIGYNHLISDYYWETVNKQLASPYDVRWDATTNSPNNAATEKCTITTGSGWQDMPCSSSAPLSSAPRYACQGSLIDSYNQPTTFAPITTTKLITSTASTTTTTRPAYCTSQQCPITPPCPSGYTYDDCFDSCYRVVNNKDDFHNAIKDCMLDGAHLFVPNIQDEYKRIMSWPGVAHNQDYWLGLTDNCRFGPGSLGFSYTNDPDKEWEWMDESKPTITAPYAQLAKRKKRGLLAIASSNTHVWTNGDYDWLGFGNNPSTTSDRFSYFSWDSDYGWLVYTTANYNQQKAYICEYSAACSACPANWNKYLTKCFKYISSDMYYSDAQSLCQSSAYMNSNLWTPRTETMLWYSWMMAGNVINQAIWLGMDKFQGSWKTVDDGIDVTASNALRMMSGEPSGSDTVLYVGNDGNWRGSTNSSQKKVVCQMGSPGIATTSTSTTSTTTTTASCKDGCCPCGFKYNRNTNKCYQFSTFSTTRSNAMKACATQGSYLVSPTTLTELQNVFTDSGYTSDFYWTSLSKTLYGFWNWPDGVTPPTNTISSPPLSTNANCYGAMLTNVPPQGLVAVCTSPTASPTSYSPVLNYTAMSVSDTHPFICEIADPCKECLILQPEALLSARINDNGYLLPLRVSPTKCIWIFDDRSNVRANSTAACKRANLSPLTLLYRYENEVLEQYLTVSNDRVWIDLGLTKNTPYTWDGESTTYSRLGITPTNSWQQPCANIDSKTCSINVDACINQRYPICTIPSAQSCSELCPVGFTWLAGDGTGGSCFKVVKVNVNDPFAARQACYSSFGTYTLASIHSDAVLNDLVNHLSSLGISDASHFWIGLDNSIRRASMVPTNYVTFTGDPDAVWEWDNTAKTFPSAAANFWAVGEPVSTNGYAYVIFDANTPALKVATAVAGSSLPKYYICERSHPCSICEPGWIYFNGHCYLSVGGSIGYFMQYRSTCDFYGGYLMSVGSPIENKFGDNVVWFNKEAPLIGLYRTRNALSSNTPPSYWEWDDGTNLAENNFMYWYWQDPSCGWYETGGSANLEIISGASLIVNTTSSIYGSIYAHYGWFDVDYNLATLGLVCEKEATTVNYACPKTGSGPSACGENLLTNIYTNVSSGYGASTYNPSNPPLGMAASGTAWIPLTTDLAPYITISFGSNSVYMRSLATVGATAGYVLAYQLGYSTSAGSSVYQDLYVHRAVTYNVKLGPLTFAGNAKSTVKNPQEICPRRKTYGIKITPKDWVTIAAMRIELRGCSSVVAVTAFCDCWVEIIPTAGQAAWYSSSQKAAFPFHMHTVSQDSIAAGAADGTALPPEYSNLHTTPNAWTPYKVDTANWWLATFSVLKVVTGLVMQGSQTSSEFITRYYIQWSHTGYAYTFINYAANDGQARLFVGPRSAATVTQQTFCPPMKALAIKIVPQTYYVSKPSLLIDLFGCGARGKRCFDCCDEMGMCTCACPIGWTGTTCDTVVTDKQYYIDAQPPVCENVDLAPLAANSTWGGSVTSSTGTAGQAVAANQVATVGWTPVIASDAVPYVQFDFGKTMSVSMIQVAGTASGQTTAYSLWFYVDKVGIYYPLLSTQTEPTSAILALPGARDANGLNFIPYRLCPNVRSRRIRLSPLTYQISPVMRVKVFGCPTHAPCSTCCTSTDGCTCKCPVGYVTNYQSSSVSNPWDHCEQWNFQPIDCEDLALRSPGLPSGIYTIFPPGRPSIEVYCEMTMFGGGWTVFQKRVDRTQDFYLGWSNYKAGFGNLNTNFWLGNDVINMLTQSINSYSLLVAMTTIDDVIGIAHYSSFYIENEVNKYTLRLGSFTCGNAADSLTYHNNQPFSTKDRDNNGNNCASSFYGAWWYWSCHVSNLNGVYGSKSYAQGVNWYHFRGHYESMKATMMMIRRSPLPYSLPSFTPNYRPAYPTDCQDILDGDPMAGSGVYRIFPAGIPLATIIYVYCDMAALGGGWTTIQRHYDYTVDFNVNMLNYMQGFGNVQGNFYLGNNLIKTIAYFPTTNLPYTLAVVMEDWAGEKRTAYYDTFYYNGTSPIYGYFSNYRTKEIETPGDSLSVHNGKSFKTPDQALADACPGTRKGGWFFDENMYSASSGYCLETNPNGAYGNGNFEMGINWVTWKGRYESLKSITMMIKRRASKPYDCQDILTQNPMATNNVYWIYPLGMLPMQVRCSMTPDSKGSSGWTVIQRRNTGAQPFYFPWSTYKAGFGVKNLEYWLGNDNIYQLTKSAAYSLRIIMVDPAGTEFYALYDSFRISSEADGYRLYVSGYNSGVSNAGDSLMGTHSGYQFSTFDQGPSTGCAITFKGAWWYNACHASNLNGLYNSTNYADGPVWSSARGYYVPMMFTEMSIKRQAVRNLPNTITTQVCSPLNVLLHECTHPFQQLTGDNYRMPVLSLGIGFYSGNDVECQKYPEPIDCTYIHRTAATPTVKFMSQTTSGLSTPTLGSFTAFCDQTTMGGGWTVIQRRVDNTQTFLQDDKGYDSNFGSYIGNFWLGNSVIRGLTAMDYYELLIEMRDSSNNYAFALYNLFYTSSSVNILHIANYQSCSTAGDSLLILNGLKFIVDDCGTGGWWRNVSCVRPILTSNLNSPYSGAATCDRGIFWYSYANNFCPTLTWTEMKIRRYASHGRYVVAQNFVCSRPSVLSYVGAADDQACQDACTACTGCAGGSTCVLAVYDRVGNCTLRSSVCRPNDGWGATDPNYDTYYRLDSCTMFSPSCGPAPSMYGTNQEIVDMPNSLTVNYTCRPGFTNSLWIGDWTSLTCNLITKKWVGRWLDCKTLCGDYPILPNANMLPDITIGGGIMTLYYQCAVDFEWVAGDLTRICAPPYGIGNWVGDYLNCTSTLCQPLKPLVPHSTDNSTLMATPVNRRYTVLNYTCDRGYIFPNLIKWSTTYCDETRLWSPQSPGLCIPLSCSKAPFVGNAIISPNAANATAVWDYMTTVLYVCQNEQVIDPLGWDNNVSISCVANNTWSVINYVGPNGPMPMWLPSACSASRKGSQVPSLMAIDLHVVLPGAVSVPIPSVFRTFTNRVSEL